MKYALKKIRRMRVYDIATGQHKVTLADMKTAQFTGSQETVYAEGSDGSKLASFDINKVAGFNATNGAIDSGFIALQVGSDEVQVTDGSEIMLRSELITADGEKVALPHKAVGDVGNEIGFIYAVDVNGMPGKSYIQGSAASATEFAYDPATKEITLPTGAFNTKDTVVVDYYPKFSKYSQINNEGDKFAFTGLVIVDAWFTDLCGTGGDVLLQVRLDKGKISGEIDLSFGDQAAVQNVAVEALVSACSGESKTLWKMFTYDEKDVSED